MNEKKVLSDTNNCFIFATTKEIRRAECAKQSARFFYYSELKRYERKKVLSDTNKKEQ